ncbi:GNAT family N-acetyltransferase [Dactylosporangium sp. NPDC000521]|uniref:GNAT family N-acetyltransferase n=1 Tax=Dactylosporangium sp. NPDC000521 TaxID=3363975 RepID=UPI003693D0CD
MDVAIERLTAATDETVEAFARLLPQLSASATPLDAAALEALLTWPGNRILAARVDGRVVGVLTLVTFPVPTGLRARIEDVVVDESARGHGAGAALMREALRLAEAEGARSVDLTSRPDRVSAIRLYERLGFTRRASTTFRFTGAPAPSQAIWVS